MNDSIKSLTSTLETMHTAALPLAEKPLTVNLALACRILSRFGHDDMNQGQVSARLPRASRFYIKNAQAGFSEATPDTMTSEPVDHTQQHSRQAPPELPLHQAIYGAHDSVNAIVHSHAPYTLLMGAADVELRALSHEGAWLLGDLRRFTKTSNTVLSIDIGHAIVEAMDHAAVVLLRNHGGVITGKSLREAVVRALALERACMLQLTAAATGLTFTSSASGDVSAKREYIFSDVSIRSYWDYLKRTILKTSDEARTW